MPPMKISSRASAPIAPHQAEAAGRSATATASSTKGRSTPSGAARTLGRPKSFSAFWDPARSAILASADTRKTAASSKRAARSKIPIIKPPDNGDGPVGRQSTTALATAWSEPADQLKYIPLLEPTLPVGDLTYACLIL